MSQLTEEEINSIVMHMVEKLGDEFHDIVCDTIHNSDIERSDDWEPSDEEVYRIKMELGMGYLMEYKEHVTKLLKI